MPLFDVQARFSNDQAITTGTQASTDIIDLGAPGTPPQTTIALGKDLGKGKPVPILIQVTTAFASGTSLQAILQTDDNSGFSSAVAVFTSLVVVEADLIAGFKFNLQYVPEDVERFLRISYVTVGTHTAGNVMAGIVSGQQTSIGS